MVICQFSVQGQWYYRHHRVNDPLLLKQWQFNQSQTWSLTYLALGSGLAVGGTVTLITVLNNIEGSKNPFDFSDIFDNAIYTISIMPFILTGVIIMSINGSNCSKIKKARNMVLNNTGRMNLNPTLIRGPGNTFNPGLTLAVRF